MMLNIKLDSSNDFSFADSSTRLFFTIKIIGKMEDIRQKKGITGNWLIIVIDQSSSMVGEKLETAKQAAISAINELNPGNYVSIYSFSDDVEIVADHTSLNDVKRLENSIKEISAHGKTALFKTLDFIINKAKPYAEDAGSVTLIMLTDGQPTDMTDIHRYESIAGMAAEYGIKINSIGIGSDYNEEIIKKISDITNGEFYNIVDRSQIGTIFGSYVQQLNKTVATSAVMSVKVREGADFKSYDQNFIQQGDQYLLNVGMISDIPFIITGQVVIPPGPEGPVNIMNISIDYKDENGVSKSDSIDFKITRTNDSRKIVSSTRQDVINAARVKMNVEKFEYLTSVGDITGATKAIGEARKAAEATKNIKLIESTRKLENIVSSAPTGKVDKKQIYNETSRIKKKGD